MERSLRRTRGARRGFGTARTGGAVRTDAPGRFVAHRETKSGRRSLFVSGGRTARKKIMKKLVNQIA